MDGPRGLHRGLAGALSRGRQPTPPIEGTGILGHEDYRALRRLQESQGQEAVEATVQGWLDSRQALAHHFRIRPLFEALVPDGRELLMEWSTGGGSFSSATRRLLEAGAVVSSSFSNITGQIVYSRTLEYFSLPEFVFTKEVDTMPSQFLGMEKIAGISNLGDENEIVDEGMPYPMAGVQEDWIEAPAARKRGTIVALTWESVFSDRTGDLLKRAGEVGKWLGHNKEKRVIDAIVDENTGAVSATLGGHRYHWRGTSYATHQTNAAVAPFYNNVVTGNALVDWTDVEGAELQMSRIRDPYTNEPMEITPDVVIVTKQLEYTARYVIQATTAHIATGGYPTNATATRYELPNFLPKYRVLTSQLLETRMTTDTDWYLANLKRAVCYKEIRPLTVDQAPANHPDEFNRDIVNQWKVSEFGAAFVQEPRAMIESRA